MSALEALDSRNAALAAAPEDVLQGLFQRHSDKILGFCVRRLGSRQEAEDAHQNTFLHAFRALQRGVRPVSEMAWLFKIAENACLAAHRANGRRRSREADHDPELAVALPRGEDGPETTAALRAALGRLPESQRQALLLREWRGFSYREIAAELGLTVAAVETLIFRARRGVAKALERDSGIRARLADAFNLGPLVAALKGVLTGGAAMKIGGAAAVLVLAALPAGDSPISTDQTPALKAPPAGSTEPKSSVDTGAGIAGHRSRARSSTAGGPTASAAKSTSHAAGGRRNDRTEGPGPGGSGAPGSTGQTGGAEESATKTPAPPTENQVQVPPALPEVDVPALPELLQLPQAPAIPQVPEVPQVPQLPQLPQAPDLPGLPDLPADPGALLPPS